MEMRKKMFRVFMMLAVLFLPMAIFGAEIATGGSGDFIVPFNEMLTEWMKGNVGITIALIIMIISVVAGAFGGGFGVIGKGFVLSIIVGGVVWFANKAFDIGAGFKL